MGLSVKEIFGTFQGEGSRAGQPAIFVRLAGCNLWSGLEAGRATGKGDCAQWCDTDFVHGTRYEPDALVEAIRQEAAASGLSRVLVVLTGGEPLLQIGREDGLVVVESMRRLGWEVAIETNGTRPISRELAPLLSHVTVSPKGLRGVGLEPNPSTEHLHSFAATDLKVVVPCPMPLGELLRLYPRAVLYFQPRDSGDVGAGQMQAALHLARLHGGRLCLQTHKFAGMP